MKRLKVFYIELPPKAINKRMTFMNKLRGTITQLTKSNTVNAEIQTSCKTEEVQIDNQKAIVMYETLVGEDEEMIHREGTVKEVREPFSIKAPKRDATSEVKYIKETEEHFEVGETGRQMLKVQGEDGQSLLIDRGKHKIIETKNMDIQTEEYKVVEKEGETKGE